jgi:hypothetical protein
MKRRFTCVNVTSPVASQSPNITVTAATVTDRARWRCQSPLGDDGNASRNNLHTSAAVASFL